MPAILLQRVATIARETTAQAAYSENNFTSLSYYRRPIRATRCFTPIVLYTKVDGQCDKLATVDCS